MDYLINKDEPDCIQNKLWMSDGDLYLRTCMIPRQDILVFIEWLITNKDIEINDVLSECIPQETIQRYAHDTFEMYTADEWMTQPEEDNV